METPTVLHSLERATFSCRAGVPPFTWGQEKIRFPTCSVFYSLEFLTMYSVQNLSNSFQSCRFQIHFLPEMPNWTTHLTDFLKYGAELAEQLQWHHRANHVILTARVDVFVLSIRAVSVTVAYKPLWHADCWVSTRKGTLCAGTWKIKIWVIPISRIREYNFMINSTTL
jgi:hypothetical protein